MQKEFIHIEKYLYMEINGQKRFKNGIDVGCGTNRLSDKIISIDQQPDPRYAHNQLIWDCKDLEIFNDNTLDFIFSSHCLEDFSNISEVFFMWWKKLKINGLMILLLPDMENGRYPKVGAENGNPSHRTNVGKNYIENMLRELFEKDKIKYKMLQVDTIPHAESCTIDFVIEKIK